MPTPSFIYLASGIHSENKHYELDGDQSGLYGKLIYKLELL